MIRTEIKHKHSLSKKISTRIVTGFFLIVPITITLWIAAFLYEILTSWSTFIIELKAFDSIREEFFAFDTIIRVLSLFLILLVLFVFGVIAKYAIGLKTIKIVERFIMKIPMLNVVYSTSQQLVDAVRNPNAGMFRQVVLFEYPRKDIYVIGFLTNENSKACELREKIGKEIISIFLPTTPNPTSGFLLFVPRNDCVFLDMSITEAMRMIISGGAVSPPGPNHTVVIDSEAVRKKNKEALKIINAGNEK